MEKVIVLRGHVAEPVQTWDDAVGRGFPSLDEGWQKRNSNVEQPKQQESSSPMRIFRRKVRSCSYLFTMRGYWLRYSSARRSGSFRNHKPFSLI
ncbi:hypothetical protein J6590_096229 [Homalodisca vitripennis]|nr:hypothetical protein J6590_030529 [Homalodisca vitripennis]KAG8324271.1 hypothetical protein J6590_096229 [Homalodisca vitripennis]